MPPRLQSRIRAGLAPGCSRTPYCRCFAVMCALGWTVHKYELRCEACFGLQGFSHELDGPWDLHYFRFIAKPENGTMPHASRNSGPQVAAKPSSPPTRAQETANGTHRTLMITPRGKSVGVFGHPPITKSPAPSISSFASAVSLHRRLDCVHLYELDDALNLGYFCSSDLFIRDL